MTLQAHEGSIPGLPDIGKALSGISVDFMVPRLGAPGDDGDGDDGDEEGTPHFIKDATVHFSLLLTYILANKLPKVTSLVLHGRLHSHISSPPLYSIYRQDRRSSVLQPH